MSSSSNNKSTNSSDEKATPPYLTRRINRSIDGFNVDVAAGAEKSPIADERYTIEDDGLVMPWFGKVWCNPPYSEPHKWVNKASEEWSKDDVDLIVFLVKGDSSTNWWHDLYELASYVCFIDRRLSFGEGSNSAPFPNHIFTVGEPTDELLEELEDIGAVVPIKNKGEN